MKTIVEELNAELEGSIVSRLLSDFGNSIYFPKGIVAQSDEARQHAHYLNATIGMARQNNRAIALPMLQNMLPELSSDEAVAYAPTAGILGLRKRWQELLLSKNPSLAGKEISLPIVVAGITSGIFQLSELFVDVGDRILSPDLFWGNYRLIISLRRGGIIDTFPMFGKNNEFNVDGFRNQLQECLNNGKGKVIILLNFPNNPTGYSPTRSESAKISEIILAQAKKGNSILTVHDDAYFALFYEEDSSPESLFSSCADLHPNVLSLKIDGATKEDYAWGFRVGFMTFASKGMKAADFDPLIKKVMGSIRSSLSNCSSLAQNTLLNMLNHPNYMQEKQEIFKIMLERYRCVQNILANTYAKNENNFLSEILRPLPFNSGYFMAFQVMQISAENLRQELLKQGIGTIALGEGLLRVAFSAIDKDHIAPLFEAIFSTAKQLHAENH